LLQLLPERGEQARLGRLDHAAIHTIDSGTRGGRACLEKVNEFQLVRAGSPMHPGHDGTVFLQARK
jgi:hypothetical protein